MRNPCKECIYYHEENKTCQSKKCATGGIGKVTLIDRLFCKPFTTKVFASNIAVGKSDKYRWHDLRKNPEELPEAWGFTEKDIYSLIVNVYTDKFSFPLVGYMNTETKEWFFPLEERTFKDCDLGNVVKWSNIRSFKDEK